MKMKKESKTIVSESLQEFEEPQVALFENMFSIQVFKKISLKDFLMGQKYKTPVEIYRRDSRDTNQRRIIKNTIACVTPSSNANYRDEPYFKECKNAHTGLICIDIDAKDNEGFDLDKAKHIIGEECPSLYYAGLSIGGEGIFLIFRISNPELHREHFNALVYYLKERFNLNVDRAVQSPVHLRVASYDENPYYNPNPTQFKLVMEIRSSPMPIKRSPETREQVENAVLFIKRCRIDITNKYYNWFKIGSALAHEFGEEGRKWFHIVSSMHNGYNKNECDFEYDKCLRYKKGKVKIATFFYFCKSHGVKYWQYQMNRQF